MIRLAVVSGKGGTGKTMVAAALADISGVPQVLADCDVDAANLELLFEPRRLTTEEFRGSRGGPDRPGTVPRLRHLRRPLPVRGDRAP